MDRKAFNFYKSYYDVFDNLQKDKDKLAFVKAIFEKQFKNIDPIDLKGQALFAYISQKHSIEAQVSGFITKTSAPPCLAPPVRPSVQEKGEEKGKGQEKEKGKVKEQLTTSIPAAIAATIEQREALFMERLSPFVFSYGKEMLRNFFNYWTEKNTNGKKMRFEMQKVFQIERRLTTWSNNDKFKGNGKQQLTDQINTGLANIAAKYRH